MCVCVRARVLVACVCLQTTLTCLLAPAGCSRPLSVSVSAGLALSRSPPAAAWLRRLPDPPPPTHTPKTNAPTLPPRPQEGGLGDVVTALGRAVQEEGHEVEVVLPKYDCINYNMVQVGWPLPACVQCMHGLHVRAFVCPVCVWRRGGVRMQQQPRPAHCREAAPGASPPTTTFSSLDSHTPHRSTHPTPPTSPPQDLRMVKDYFMDGVQVKIWKGYVEGERALHGGGGGGGCSVCVCVCMCIGCAVGGIARGGCVGCVVGCGMRLGPGPAVRQQAAQQG